MQCMGPEDDYMTMKSLKDLMLGIMNMSVLLCLSLSRT
jgi:hypothetical protein